MKNILYIITLLITLLFDYSAAAADLQKTTLAFIDRDKIISEALVVKSIKDQIDDKRIELQKEFTVKEEELRKSENDLAKQKELLSPEAFEEKITNFNKLVMATQRDVSLKRSELENLYMNSMDTVYDRIKDISSKIAKENNIDLILFLLKKNQVFYSSPKIDISDKVLVILNKELPNLNIKKT